MPRKILYIAPSLPALTCTFIYREIFDLRDLGFEIDTISMNKPATDEVSQEAMGLLDTSLYLDQVPLSYKLSAFPLTRRARRERARCRPACPTTSRGARDDPVRARKECRSGRGSAGAETHAPTRADGRDSAARTGCGGRPVWSTGSAARRVRAGYAQGPARCRRTKAPCRRS